MPPLTEGILFRSPLVLSYQLFLGSHLLHTNTTIISLNPTFFHILLLLWSKDSLPTAAASPLLMLQLFGPSHTDQLFLWQGLHSAFTSVPVTQILSSVFLTRPPSHDTNLLLVLFLRLEFVRYWYSWGFGRQWTNFAATKMKTYWVFFF